MRRSAARASTVELDLPRTIPAAPLYRQIASAFEDQIRQGILRPGERLPSVRTLSRRRAVSVTTIVQAYVWLERFGYVEARPRSGFVACLPPEARAPEPAIGRTRSAPVSVGVGEAVARAMLDLHNPRIVPLGAAAVDPTRLPTAVLNRHLHRAARTAPEHAARCSPAAGVLALRRQIARHALSFGCAFPVDEITTTIGAMEALNLALRAVAGPGEAVAVESPTYFGVLQILQALGLRALEIPTHPARGPDLDQLESALRRHRVKSFVSMTTCHNPLGYVLDDDRKRELVALMARHQVPLVEDDVYGELAFGDRRPRPAKAFDREGLVLLVSSFSKTVGPGLRVGWIHGGRFAPRLELLKSVNTVSSPVLPQLALAAFVESGGYLRHLRSLRSWLAGQVKQYAAAVREHFPPGTRVSRPAGGHLLWVQLPGRGDGDLLAAAAHEAGISLIPGSICSPRGQYREYVRVNCGSALSPAVERALRTLGRLAAR